MRSGCELTSAGGRTGFNLIFKEINVRSLQDFSREKKIGFPGDRIFYATVEFGTTLWSRWTGQRQLTNDVVGKSSERETVDPTPD